MYGTKHLLVSNLIVYYHYRTVYKRETVTGHDILIHMSRPCWRTSSRVFSCIITHVRFFLIPSVRSLRFGSRLWKVNIDQKWNLFYHYLFQRTPVIYNVISRENVFLFAIYFHLNMKLSPDKFFCFVTLKNCLRQHQLRSQVQ